MQQEYLAMNRLPAIIGVYCPGKGISGPSRSVHSILKYIDINEWDGVYLIGDQHAVNGNMQIGEVAHIHSNNTAPLSLRYALSALENSTLKNRLRDIVPKGVKLTAGFFRDAWALAGRFHRCQIDVIHTHKTGCEESPIAARLAGVPKVIGTFHVDSSVDVDGRCNTSAHRMMEMVSNRCLDKAIAVSEATKKDWLKRTHMSADRIVTIHNGIDPEVFQRKRSKSEARAKLGLKHDGIIIGAVGRLDKVKGFEYLIEAVAKLKSRFAKLHLAIAGEGPLRKQLELHCHNLGVSNSVHFLGFQDDVQLVLDSIDVFAMPSLCETLGYALLEAMATELPAVGSSVGGIPEVIQEGVTGYLVPSRNSDQLVVKLAVLLNDPEMRHNMGTAARQRVIRHFHEKDMVRKTIDLYREMTKYKRKHRAWVA